MSETVQKDLKFATVANLVERRLGTGFRITKLAMRPDLLHWERHFIRGLSNQTRISPTQQKILDRLWRQYEGKAP